MLQPEPLGYYIKKIHQTFVSQSNKSLKKFGLTSSQLDILVYLLRHSDRVCTQREIEKYYGLSHATVIGTLQRLIDKGYINVYASEEDKRQRNVFLTDLAFEIEEEMVKEWENNYNKFKRHMSEEEIENLVEGLKKVYIILQEDDE